MSLFSYCDFFQPDDYEYGFGQFVSCHDVMKPTIDKNFNIVWPKGYTVNDALEWRRSKGPNLPPLGYVKEHGSKRRPVKRKRSPTP